MDAQADEQVSSDAPQGPYDKVGYLTNQMMGHRPPASVGTQAQLAKQKLEKHNHPLQQQLQQQLKMFWANQYEEIEQMNDFNNHSLPLKVISKIMKEDDNGHKISVEVPVVFSKACEMFIQELTLRSWIHAEENMRRCLGKKDISAAATRTDNFEFLVDIDPGVVLKDELHGSIPMAGAMPVGGPTEVIAYNPGPIMGEPVIDQALSVQQPSLPQQIWQQQERVDQQQQSPSPDDG